MVVALVGTMGGGDDMDDGVTSNLACRCHTITDRPIEHTTTPRPESPLALDRLLMRVVRGRDDGVWVMVWGD